MNDQNAKRMLGDQYFNQVSESIKNVFELSTRIDERVQLMMKKQEDLEKKLDAQMQKTNDMTTRVTVLESQVQKASDMNNRLAALESKNNNQEKIKEISESVTGIAAIVHNMELKVQSLEGNTKRQEARWKTIFGFVVQLIWVVLAAYLLYRLGLQSPGGP
jgi:uncharacterized coiled-coil protein SlyX